MANSHANAWRSAYLAVFLRPDLAVGLLGLPITKVLLFVDGFGLISLLPFSLGSLISPIRYKYCLGSALHDRLFKERIADKGLETFLVWPELQQLYRREKPERLL